MSDLLATGANNDERDVFRLFPVAKNTPSPALFSSKMLLAERARCLTPAIQQIPATRNLTPRNRLPHE
jgi:hypothetical protein